MRTLFRRARGRSRFEEVGINGNHLQSPSVRGSKSQKMRGHTSEAGARAVNRAYIAQKMVLRDFSIAEAFSEMQFL